MELKQKTLGDFFSSIKKIINKSGDQKERVITIVRGLTGVVLATSQIQCYENSVSIHASPIEKMEILSRKKMIEEKLRSETGETYTIR